MNKKLFATSIIFIGLFLATYGLITASVSNGPEIVKRYDCERITKDLRPTDKYCDDLKSAPEAEKYFGNKFVYVGVAITALGGLLIITKPKR